MLRTSLAERFSRSLRQSSKATRWSTAPKRERRRRHRNSGTAGLEQLETRTLLSAAAIEVGLDISPNDDGNSIDPESTGRINVAILSTADFDAVASVDRESLTFGHDGQENSLHRYGNGSPDARPEDVNSDGLIDLVVRFSTEEADFRKGDAEGFLRGQTLGGETFEGSDAVQIEDNGGFSSVLVFGDSLSDTGNVFNVSGGAFAGEPYFGGSFTNGPTWVEELASELHLPEPLPSTEGGTNYAYGNARTGSGLSNNGVPNIGTQIGQFLSDPGNSLDGSEVIAILGGANDFFQQFNTPAVAVANIADHVTTLANAGGEHFIVGNYGPLGAIPAALGTPFEQPLTAASEAFAALLPATLDQLETDLGVRIELLDTRTPGLNPEESFGVTNITEPAYGNSGVGETLPEPFNIVANPDDYLWWDQIHPTRVWHEVIGQTAAGLVRDEPGDPVTFTVTNTNDAGPGSLRQAIQDANDRPGPDEINFHRRLRGTITLTTGELEIDDDVTINGPGAHRVTVSGGGISRVFNITGSETDVEISRLTIADGVAGDVGQATMGGGILNDGASVELDRVNFSDNRATGVLGGGAGIANVFGGQMTVNLGVFTDNQAAGFFFAAGGAILNDAGSSISINLSTFRDNSAIALGGGSSTDPLQGSATGGAFTSAGGSDAIVTYSTFVGNVSRSGDGAVGQAAGAFATGGAMTSSNNSLIAPPGASTLEVAYTTFISNEARGGNGGDGSVGQDGGTAGAGQGGAVLNDLGSVATFVGSTFIRNMAVSGNGGRGGAGGNGGATGFQENGAAGGAIINAGSILSVSRSSFIGNDALGGNGGDGRAGGNGADGARADGGAILNAPSLFNPTLIATADVDRSVFVNNRAVGGRGGNGFVSGIGGNGGGGAVASFANRSHGDEAHLNLSRIVLLFNRAVGGNGGGRGATGGDGQGGGVYNGENSTLTLDRSIVALNKAFGGFGAATSGVGTGGGLFNIGTLNASGRDLDRIFANWASDDCDDLFDNGLCV